MFWGCGSGIQRLETHHDVTGSAALGLELACLGPLSPRLDAIPLGHCAKHIHDYVQCWKCLFLYIYCLLYELLNGKIHLTEYFEWRLQSAVRTVT